MAIGCPLGVRPIVSHLASVWLRRHTPNAGQLHALMLSWGASIGNLPDQGKDLDALTFSKTATGYTISTEQIAEGFKNPIDEVLIGNNLYVPEYGEGGSIWELTFS